jgi:hypothetical protein
MPSKICSDRFIDAGTPCIIECYALAAPYSVVFEDDGETGYFYALENPGENARIVDELHIYNVSSVKSPSEHIRIQVVWSDDGLHAALVVNRRPEAVFDFAAKRGFCRSGFPPSSSDWSVDGHQWNDSVLGFFQ